MTRSALFWIAPLLSPLSPALGPPSFDTRVMDRAAEAAKAEKNALKAQKSGWFKSVDWDTSAVQYEQASTLYVALKQPEDAKRCFQVRTWERASSVGVLGVGCSHPQCACTDRSPPPPSLRSLPRQQLMPIATLATTSSSPKTSKA